MHGRIALKAMSVPQNKMEPGGWLVTTAGRDDLAMGLLREFGWPFRGETPVQVAASAATAA